MKKLLIVVDYQKDFVCDNGKLTVGKSAQEIEKAIIEKISLYRKNNDNIIFTMDSHSKEDWLENKHPESKAFAEHCIKGTDGYELVDSINKLSKENEIIDKRAYCPNISAQPLKSLIENADAFEICGVVTDICVFQTVIGLYTYLVNSSKNVNITVDAKSCASFNPEREQEALVYMKDILNITVKHTIS